MHHNKLTEKNKQYPPSNCLMTVNSRACSTLNALTLLEDLRLPVKCTEEEPGGQGTLALRGHTDRALRKSRSSLRHSPLRTTHLRVLMSRMPRITAATAFWTELADAISKSHAVVAFPGGSILGWYIFLFFLVSTYVGSMHMGKQLWAPTCAHVEATGDYEVSSFIALHLSSSRQGHSQNQKLAISSRLAGQWVPRICPA